MKGNDMKSDVDATAFVAILVVCLISVGFSSAVYWGINQLITQSIEGMLSLPIITPGN